MPKDFPDKPTGYEPFEPFEKEYTYNQSGDYMHDRGDFVEVDGNRQAHPKPEQLWPRE